MALEFLNEQFEGKEDDLVLVGFLHQAVHCEELRAAVFLFVVWSEEVDNSVGGGDKVLKYFGRIHEVL